MEIPDPPRNGKESFGLLSQKTLGRQFKIFFLQGFSRRYEKHVFFNASLVVQTTNAEDK